MLIVVVYKKGVNRKSYFFKRRYYNWIEILISSKENIIKLKVLLFCNIFEKMEAKIWRQKFGLFNVKFRAQFNEICAFLQKQQEVVKNWLKRM